LVDLYFASAGNKKLCSCSICPKEQKKLRNCEQKGFRNVKKPRRVDGMGMEFYFCPGKAQWYPNIAETFEQCRIALETGIMPETGSFLDQNELFVEAFPLFVERWKYRKYLAIWQDVMEYTPKVLEAVGRMFGGKAK